MKHGDANAKGAWQQPLYDPGRGSIAAPARADYAKKLKRRNSLAAQESPEKGQQLPSTKPLEQATRSNNRHNRHNRHNRQQDHYTGTMGSQFHTTANNSSAAQQQSSAPRR